MADVATYVIRLKFVASMDTAGLRAADATVNKMTRDLEALNAALRKLNQTPDPGGFKGMGHNVSAAADKVRVLRRELSLIRSRDFQINPVHGPVQPTGQIGMQTGSPTLNMLGRTAMMSASHMAVSTAMNAVGDSARFMFNANVGMDEAIGNLAVLSFINDGVSVEEAKASATEKAKVLARLAAEGTGGLGDYLEANQRIYSPARTAGATDEQIQRLVRGAVVSGTILLGEGGARSAALDVQQALTQGIGDRITPLLNLALRGAGLPSEAEDFNKLSLEKRLEHILTALEKFNEAEVLAKSKFTTQVDILRENLAEMARSLTGDMFQDLVDGLTTLNDVLAALRPYSNFIAENVGGILADNINPFGTAQTEAIKFFMKALPGEEAAPTTGPVNGPSVGGLTLPGTGSVFAAPAAAFALARWFNGGRESAPTGPQFNMVADANLQSFIGARRNQGPAMPFQNLQWWEDSQYDGMVPFYKMGTGSEWLDRFHKLNEPGYGAPYPEPESFFGHYDDGRGKGKSTTTIKVEWGDRSLATALTNVVRDASSRQMDASLSSRDSGEVF